MRRASARGRPRGSPIPSIEVTARKPEATVDIASRLVEHSIALGDSRSLWIPAPAGRLEAALRVAEPARALAVVTHPHPEHGGTLHNPVVFHSDRELNRAGFTTLRFNFRGVGESEGSHDHGEGEVADVAAAVGWLAGLARGLPLVAVGYSFGSWCAARCALDDRRVSAMIAVGMPVEHYDFGVLRRFGRPFAAVHGSDDELASPEKVRGILREMRPPGELRVVPGGTHLFPGRAADAAAEVVAAAAFLSKKPSTD